MSGCGKYTYPSRKVAKIAARRQPEKGKLRPYKCMECSAEFARPVYHLTSYTAHEQHEHKNTHRGTGTEI